MYFPAKKFIKILVCFSFFYTFNYKTKTNFFFQIEFVNPVVRHENPLYRRAALAALAVTSEGCADHYRNQ